MTNKPLRNIRLVVEYDGTHYVGWQKQHEGASIQGELEAAIHSITGENVKLIAAGRTDAGVHAQGQVCNFLTHSEIPARKFAPGLNFYSPDSISVHLSTEAPIDFSARYHSVAKRYRYRVYSGLNPAALENRAWFRGSKIDIESMRRGANYLIGEKDFEAFRSAHCDAKHARREIFDIQIEQFPRGPLGTTIDIIFHGNAFCRHMIRILAGSLVEVGKHKQEPQWIEEVLLSRDRTRAGQTAPAQGLTLLEVYFDDIR